MPPARRKTAALQKVSIQKMHFGWHRSEVDSQRRPKEKKIFQLLQEKEKGFYFFNTVIISLLN
jgi:hypothetical protein